MITRCMADTADMVQSIGRLLLVFGLVLTVVGASLMLAGRLGMGRLPGDLSFGGRNWRVYVPLGTCIVLSIILTIVMWIVLRMKRG